MIEVDHVIGRDGVIKLKNEQFPVSTSLVGQRVSVRLDGHLMHVIANNALVKTLPYPITLEKRLALAGARQATSPLPPAPPRQAPQAERRLPKDGIIMVARQRLRVGTTHAGKIVTVVIEDTNFRVLHGEQELSLHPRDPNRPITRMKPYARRR